MSTLKPDTKILQSQMAGYCRVPQYDESIEGTRPERLPHYRRLVFNIVEDTLQNAYPITHSLLTEEEWMQLVNDFFSQHDCQSPQLWRMPFELVEYAEQSDYHLKLHKPYLLELLYFEWLELEVYQDEDKPHAEFQSKGDILDTPLVINPDHKLVQLTYPVHKKEYDRMEELKGNYFVLLHRHRNTYSVNFIEFSPFLAIVFSQLANNPMSLRDAVTQVAKANSINVDETLLNKMALWGDSLMNDTAILGYVK